MSFSTEKQWLTDSQDDLGLGIQHVAKVRSHREGLRHPSLRDKSHLHLYKKGQNDNVTGQAGEQTLMLRSLASHFRIQALRHLLQGFGL